MKSMTKVLLLLGALSVPLAVYAADGDSLKTKASDTLITTKVKAAFAADETVEASDIKVDTDRDGLVVLSGSAESKAEADKAVRLAQSVKGVTGVKSNITIDND